MIRLSRCWTRCGKSPVEVHHAVTRSRGGSGLDAVGSTEHLIALCRYHHSMVDNYGFPSGLIKQGFAVRGVYYGPDENMKEHNAFRRSNA